VGGCEGGEEGGGLQNVEEVGGRLFEDGGGEPVFFEMGGWDGLGGLRGLWRLVRGLVVVGVRGG
jgi:hypothetical protein